MDTSLPITISTDPTKLQLEVIHGFLTRSYWAQGVAREVIEKSLRHSLCFGAYAGDQQVGLVRVITDYTTFAYLCDVFVLEPYRGRGISKLLLREVLKHPEIAPLRRLGLITQDAQGLYAQFGFQTLAHPERHMERRGPLWRPPETIDPAHC